MTFNGYLTNQEIGELTQAALSGGLLDLPRPVLLAGIPAAYSAAMARTDNPLSQFKLDLVNLNQVERMAGGEVPMLTLLQNATEQLRQLSRTEAGVFERVLSRVGNIAVGIPPLADSTRLSKAPRDEPISGTDDTVGIGFPADSTVSQKDGSSVPPTGQRLEETRRYQETLREQKRNTSWVIRIGLVTAIIAIAAIVVPLTVSDGSGNARSPAQPTQASSEASPSASNSSASAVKGTNLFIGCPAPAGPNSRPSLIIRVAKWCLLSAVRGQAQMKLKVWLANTGSTDLDTSLDRFRLLVVTLNPTQWSPPGGLERAKVQPIQIPYDGVKVWAIPPNPDGAYEAIPSQPGVYTFATHWNLKTLSPGHSYTPTSVDVGDLVFYIPATGGGATQLRGVIGLAYVENDNQVAVICPPGNWGPRKPAESF